MATVSKEIADQVINGQYSEDGWTKIVKYTNAWGGESYGLVRPSMDQDYYKASPHVINPTVYWTKDAQKQTDPAAQS